MKKLLRLSLFALFAAVNFAILAAPADAWRTKTVPCEVEGGGEGEEATCCMTCWFFGCDDCSIDDLD